MVVDLNWDLPPRMAPARHPMLVHAPALIPVIDANLLLSLACSAARSGNRENLVTGLRMTGRAYPFVGAHVPGELAEHLPRVATRTKATPADAESILWGQIMPHVPVVDLAVRDLLSPRARQIMSEDGDVDDVETIALAELLAPAVILSTDKVFAKFGHAVAAVRAIEHATAFLRAAGIEATYADGLALLGTAAHLGLHGCGALVQSARRHPLLAGATLAIVLAVAYRYRWHKAERWRALGQHVVDMIAPAMEVANAFADHWDKARSALVIVETVGDPTLEQRCARHLARCGRALDPSQLRDALVSSGFRVSAAALRRTMQNHPAFVRLPGDIYQLGRRASTGDRNLVIA
ncbi:PIN domain-containing protein [Allorhizocola rhizosphaerae]|uniref:PIN domain-containing protein n=1 Tax=Allorhizocola rhizosphaerae TaxID=1872709 RepID=UPI0013C2E663|nr:PIN domain-containing protein [Allorhizocola rhizosphaerae]